MTRNHPSGRTLDKVQERWEKLQFIDHGQFGWQVKVLGRTQVKNLCQQGLGKGLLIHLSEWAPGVQIFVNTQQRVMPVMLDFNNHMNRMTRPVDASWQPPSPSHSCHSLICSSTKWPRWQRRKVYVGPSTCTAAHQGQTGYSHC